MHKDARQTVQKQLCAVIEKLPHAIVVAKNQSKLLKEYTLFHSHAEYEQHRRECTESHNYLQSISHKKYQKSAK